jgi:nickel-dependent lactate racemase
MKNLVRSVRKIRAKKGDIPIVTLKGYPTDYEIVQAEKAFCAMPFLKGIFMIFVNGNLSIKKGKAEQGKHRVYLNNLEFLEYMDKRRNQS